MFLHSPLGTEGNVFFPIQEIYISNSALIMVWKFSVNKVAVYVHVHMQIHEHIQAVKGILKGTY